MKVCHIISKDPLKYTGGISTVVNNLSRYNRSDIIIMKGPLKIFIFPLLTLNKIRKYDIIHLHTTQSFLFVPIAKMLGKKIVYTLHGTWLSYFRGLPPKSFLSKKKANLAIKIQKYMMEKSDAVIAVSNFTKKIIVNEYKIPDNKVIVIHNGVDTKYFYSIKKKKTNTALWVGDNPKLKGLDNAIDYCKIHNLKLLVVGVEGENSDKIEFLGKIPYEHMPDIYRKADILLFFTKAEGHPLVPLEAMACGLDVIASKESNIEIVPPQKDGSYKISGKKALKIIKKYDWKNVAKKHTEVYKKVMKMK